MNGTLAFLCLLMGKIQWERGERVTAIMTYALGALGLVALFVEQFNG